jgi:hypothetical protein
LKRRICLKKPDLWMCLKEYFFQSPLEGESRILHCL